MTPSARLSSVIELLDKIMSEAGPAEHEVRAYFRARRYAGSKDRRWITEFLYVIFRRLGEIDWIVEQLALEQTNRSRALCAMVFVEKISTEQLQEGYFQGPHAVPTLDEAEIEALGKLDALDVSAMPDHSKENFPEWIASILSAQFGKTAPTVMRAYQERAPLTLRVNSLKAEREEVLRILTEDDIEAVPTKLSPHGIILKGQVNIASHQVMQLGLVEIQDEAAQISSLLTCATSGMQVVDYCAGSGGKSLAIAAEMDNSGEIYAFDVSLRRMKDLSARRRRANAIIIQANVMSDEKSLDEAVDRLKGQMDRVFVDVPCSGSGTWRRQPDQKWTFSEEKLENLVTLQKQILGKAARLVAPGGRLVYATCSIFDAENTNQVTEFLDKNPEFSLIPVSQIWGEAGLAGKRSEEMLKLSPDEFGTDGFFTAVLCRSA
ncbi:MAG: RsmB/NOP family class I SAM-dependent RNA methyltransferase [Sneathiella sp.]